MQPEYIDNSEHESNDPDFKDLPPKKEIPIVFKRSKRTVYGKLFAMEIKAV